MAKRTPRIIQIIPTSGDWVIETTHLRSQKPDGTALHTIRAVACWALRDDGVVLPVVNTGDNTVMLPECDSEADHEFNRREGWSHVCRPKLPCDALIHSSDWCDLISNPDEEGLLETGADIDNARDYRSEARGQAAE